MNCPDCWFNATNKATGGDGIPAELFKILNDDAIKVSANLETQQWPQDW